MNREEVLEQLKTIVKPYIKDESAYENISEDTDFIADLKINSANLVDVILDVEEAFDIVIDNDAMQQMLDVRSTLAIVQTKLAEK